MAKNGRLVGAAALIWRAAGRSRRHGISPQSSSSILTMERRNQAPLLSSSTSSPLSSSWASWGRGLRAEGEEGRCSVYGVAWKRFMAVATNEIATESAQVGAEEAGNDGGWRGVRTAGEEAKLEEVLALIEEKKGLDVVVLDSSTYTAMTSLCKQMVITTCLSKRHMGVMADSIKDHYKLKGMILEKENDKGRTVQEPPSVEGRDSDRWMLVDLGEIILHIFSREGREYYRLEQHWKDVEAAKKRGVLLEEYLKLEGRESEVTDTPAQPDNWGSSSLSKVGKAKATE